MTLANSANGYSGGTFINGGQLNLAADGDLGAVPAHPATNLTIGGGTLYAAGSFTLAQNRDVSLSRILCSTSPRGKVSRWAARSRAGGLTLLDSGSLILESANTFTGGVTVRSGTLTAVVAGACRMAFC